MVAIAIITQFGAKAVPGAFAIYLLFQPLRFVIPAIAIPLWCHRVYRNLPSLGAGPVRFSPMWAAGGWCASAESLAALSSAVRGVGHLRLPTQRFDAVLPFWAAFVTRWVLSY